MGRDSAALASGGSWFHHWGARTAKSLDWAERELPSRIGGRAKRPEVAERRARVRGGGIEHSQKVGRGSSSCCSVGKHHSLVVDASLDWKPVEEERDNMREHGMVENQAGFRILDKLQGGTSGDGTSGEPSQQRVAVVQTGKDKCLD